MVFKNLKAMNSNSQRRQTGPYSLLAALSLSGLFSSQTMAAERISIRLDAFQRSVSVTELAEFANTGKISKKLKTYFRQLKPNEQQSLRDSLNKSAPVTSIKAATFIDTPLGQVSLQQLVKVLDLPSEQAKLAMSSALIIGSQSGELTLIEGIKAYPLQTIPINVEAVASFAKEINGVISLQNNLFSRIEELEASVGSSTTQSENEISSTSKLEQLAKNGDKKYESIAFSFQRANGSKITAIAYIPTTLGKQKLMPLVVLAPGLNSNMNALLYVGRLLASHGYAVASLNFPYTSENTVHAVIKGSTAIPAPNKWFGQPKNVSELIDQIEKRWGDQINTQNVGVLGQSLGGYTATALSGASLDWDHLLEGCKPLSDPDKVVLNPAVIWQCKATGQVVKRSDFSDKRVKAVIAVNPVTNPIFSKKSMQEINIPILYISGTADIFAPPFSQQLGPYSAIQHPDRLLAVQKNGTHLSFLEGTSKLPSYIIGPDQSFARKELLGISHAFFATHLNNERELSDLLAKDPSKNTILGNEPLKIIIRSELSEADFEKVAPGMKDTY